MKQNKPNISHLEESLKSLHFQKASGRFKKVLWNTIEEKTILENKVSFWERTATILKSNIFPITSGLVAAVFVFIVFQNVQQKNTPPEEAFINPGQQVTQFIIQSQNNLKQVGVLLNLEKANDKISFQFIPHAFAEKQLELTPELRHQIALATVGVMNNNTKAIETMSDVKETGEVFQLLDKLETLNQSISTHLSQGVVVLYNTNDQSLQNLFNAAINDSQKNMDQIGKTKESIIKVTQPNQKNISISIRPSKKAMQTAQAQLGINPETTPISTEANIEAPITMETPKTTKTLKNLCEVETPSCKKSTPREKIISSPSSEPESENEIKDPMIQGIEEVFIEEGSTNGSLSKPQ